MGGRGDTLPGQQRKGSPSSVTRRAARRCLSPRWSLTSTGRVISTRRSRRAAPAAVQHRRSPRRRSTRSPDRLCLSYAALQALFDAGALDALVTVPGTIFVVGPGGHVHRTASGATQLQGGRWTRRILAAATLRAAGAGPCRAVDRRDASPRPVPLPTSRTSRTRTDAGLGPAGESRRPLELGLSFRQALLDDPDLLLLTADFFVASDIGSHPQQVPGLGLVFEPRQRP